MAEIPIPVTLFCYKQVNDHHTYTYRLDSIHHSKEKIYIPTESIRMSHMNVSDIELLKMFNAIYIKEINRNTILFMFKNETRDYVCRPSLTSATLEVIESSVVYPETDASSWDSICMSEPAVSLYSLWHTYTETESDVFKHESLCLVPNITMAIPTWISDQSLAKLLQVYIQDKLMSSVEHSIVAMRMLNNQICLHKMYDSELGKPDKYRLACRL